MYFFYYFHANVTGGQFRQIGWSKPVLLVLANTFSVEDIKRPIILVQTTTFALTAFTYVDFVIQNFRRRNTILLKIAKISHSVQYARLAAKSFVLVLTLKLIFIYSLMRNSLKHTQYVHSVKYGKTYTNFD